MPAFHHVVNLSRQESSSHYWLAMVDYWIKFIQYR